MATEPVLGQSAVLDRRPLAQWIEGWISFAVPLIVGLCGAWLLVLRYHSVYYDAQSRLANAYYVLYSRDPHLAAVGFVWNPLPSLVDLPLLLLKGTFPALATEAFAANIMSCLFYAGAAYQLLQFLRELKVGKVTRWALWLCFVANPEIFYYGINGMSEMLFIFTLIAAARYLARWVHTDRDRDLVYAAWMLGVAYMARNEAAASAVAAGLVVLVIAYRRSDTQTTVGRRQEAATALVLFISPFALAFIGWAATSWIIVGHPFEQFSSVYGNSNQIAHFTAVPGLDKTGARLKYALLGTQSLAPALVPATVLGLLRARRQLDARILAVLAVVGAVLGFEILAFGRNLIFPWYRYYFYAVPLVVMIAGCLAASDLLTPMRPPLMSTTFRNGLIGVIAFALAAPGILTTAHTMGHPGIADQDREKVAYFLWPHSKTAKFDTVPQNHRDIVDLAAQIDAMRLPRGAVMVDDFTTCIPPLILDVKRPEVFVIPNDEDYQGKMGAPYQFGVRYFIVPDPNSAEGPTDALNRQFPSLYATGQGLASLQRELHLSGCPTLRLYKLTPESA